MANNELPEVGVRELMKEADRKERGGNSNGKTNSDEFTRYLEIAERIHKAHGRNEDADAMKYLREEIAPNVPKTEINIDRLMDAMAKITKLYDKSGDGITSKEEMKNATPEVQKAVQGVIDELNRLEATPENKTPVSPANILASAGSKANGLG